MFESGDLRCTTNEIVLSKLTSLSFLISKTVCVCMLECVWRCMCVLDISNLCCTLLCSYLALSHSGLANLTRKGMAARIWLIFVTVLWWQIMLA